jgi:CDP-glucose 4,6-dehydratase
MLDITKAKTRLGWKPRLDALHTIDLVADWYKKYQSQEVYSLCIEEIKLFLR